MIVNVTVEKVWYINSVFDFINQFKLKQKVKHDYKIKKIEDIINYISDDESLIIHYLKKDKRIFDIDFISKDNGDEFWIIKELYK